MARAGCSPVGGWDPDRGRVRPCPRRLCRVPVRPRRGRPGAGAVRATRASLRGCAGSAERLGARGAGAALGAGGAPGRDELTAVAPGLSAEPGGGSSAAPRRCRAARATMLGLDACELGAQLLELLRLALCARVLLTDKDGRQLPPDEVLDEAVPTYRAPGRKSLLEIQQLDPDDESLAKYKRALLGPLPLAVDPSLPNVQVTRLTLMSEQAPGPMTMDLTGELATLKNQVFVLKEGVDYKVKITFKVNKEIVSGLKCLHHTYRQGLRVDKAVYMVGSYGPSTQEYEFITPVEEAPRGALVRGAYVVTSFFTDDDREHHLSWEWGLHICQDWKS